MSFKARARNKVVLVGSSAVGKTSIINQLVKRKFEDLVFSTVVGSSVTIDISTDNKVVPLNIWDTAGQEQYRSVVPMYFKGASVVILVFDLSRRESFEDVESWYETAKQSEENMKVVLVGNKTDLEDKRVVTKQEAERMAETIGGSYAEVSAKTADGIRDLFIGIAKMDLECNEDIYDRDRLPAPTDSSCCS